MLQRVMIDGIELPRLYIAENKRDVDVAKEKGIPYIRWTHGQDELVKILLRPVLEKMFPHIMWDKVLGRKRRFKTIVEVYEASPIDADQIDVTGKLNDNDKTLDASNGWSPKDIDDMSERHDGIIMEDDRTMTELSVSSSEERVFHDETQLEMMPVRKMDIADYVGDVSSYVNIEVLQRLRLMPAFIGNILECIKINVGNGFYWNEGYNKKRALPVGRFDSRPQLPNLIILDVSGSIPRGISATMIALIDTLRSQLSADLIITSSVSRFYPMGCKLPSPQEIRNSFGYGNESFDFFGILTRHIRGRHYGHVFSFGDNDTPGYRWFNERPEAWSISGTVVEYVHHYHTGLGSYGNTKTGYAKWCHMLAKQPIVEYDKSWCEVIRD